MGAGAANGRAQGGELGVRVCRDEGEGKGGAGRKLDAVRWGWGGNAMDGDGWWVVGGSEDGWIVPDGEDGGSGKWYGTVLYYTVHTMPIPYVVYRVVRAVVRVVRELW